MRRQALLSSGALREFLSSRRCSLRGGCAAEPRAFWQSLWRPSR